MPSSTAASTGFAAGLQQLGVQRGDRVAVILRNSVEAAIAIYGTLRAGAAFVPLNPTAKAEKLGYLLAHSEAAAAICDADIAARLHEARDHAPALRHLIVCGDAAGEHTSFAAVVETEPVALRAAPRGRPLGDHLHLRIDGGAEGRRLPAPEHAFRRRLDRRVSLASARTTGSSASCRSRTPTGSTT